MFSYRDTDKIIRKLEGCVDKMYDISDLDKGEIRFFLCVFRLMLFWTPVTVMWYMMIPGLKVLYNLQRRLDPKVKEEERTEREERIKEEREKQKIREKMLESHKGFYPYETRNECSNCGKIVAWDIDETAFYCNTGGEMGQTTRRTYEHYKPGTKEMCKGDRFTRTIRPHLITIF